MFVGSPDNRLLSVLLKLDRAEQLANELAEGLAALQGTEKWAALQERDPRGDVDRVPLYSFCVPAPFRFYGVTGDFVHNLRAPSLDQPAWQLLRMSG